MKDFAKSIRTGNKTIYDDKGVSIWGWVEKDGSGYSAYTHGITGAKTQLLWAADEKTATEELKDYCRTYWKRQGNSKIGNIAADITTDGNTWFVTTSDGKKEEFTSEREAEEYVKKIKTGNAYGWREKNGHQELYNPNVPFGGHTRGYVEKGKNGYVGAKTNGSIVISKKEFESEEEAKKYVENSKVGNARTDIIYKGRALTDDEIRKLTPSQKSEIMREYERMVRSGAISDSEMAEAMDEIKYFGRIGNSKVGNLVFSRYEDAKDLLEDYEIGKKENDQKLVDQCKRKAQTRMPDLNRKLSELKEDINDVEKAIETLKKIGNRKVGNYGYIGQYSKTQTEKKFDDLLADIAELADMASEYAFMSEQIQNAKSVLNDIVSRANQAKSLADKISEEWKKTGGRK